MLTNLFYTQRCESDLISTFRRDFFSLLFDPQKTVEIFKPAEFTTKESLYEEFSSVLKQLVLWPESFIDQSLEQALNLVHYVLNQLSSAGDLCLVLNEYIREFSRSADQSFQAGISRRTLDDVFRIKHSAFNLQQWRMLLHCLQVKVGKLVGNSPLQNKQNPNLFCFEKGHALRWSLTKLRPATVGANSPGAIALYSAKGELVKSTVFHFPAEARRPSPGTLESHKQFAIDIVAQKLAVPAADYDALLIHRPILFEANELVKLFNLPEAKKGEDSVATRSVCKKESLKELMTLTSLLSPSFEPQDTVAREKRASRIDWLELDSNVVLRKLDNSQQRDAKELAELELKIKNMLSESPSKGTNRLSVNNHFAERIQKFRKSLLPESVSKDVTDSSGKILVCN